MKGYVNGSGVHLIIDLDVPTFVKKGTEVEITEIKDTKSLRQLRLLWKIIGEIGKALNQDKDEVYLTILQLYGEKSEIYKLEFNVFKELKKVIRAYRVLDKDDKSLTVEVIFGVSKYNVKEMNKIIDNAINFAFENGVDIPER